MRTHSLFHFHPAVERTVYPSPTSGNLAKSTDARKNISWAPGGFFAGNPGYPKTPQWFSGVPMRGRSEVFYDRRCRSISLLKPAAPPLTLKEARRMAEHHVMDLLAAVIKGQDNIIAYTARVSDSLWTVPNLQQALKKELMLCSRNLLTEDVRFQNPQFLCQNLPSIVAWLSHRSSRFLQQQKEFIAKPSSVHGTDMLTDNRQSKAAPPNGLQRELQRFWSSGLTAESLAPPAKKAEPLVVLDQGGNQQRHSVASARYSRWSTRLPPNGLTREARLSWSSGSTVDSLSRIPKKMDAVTELKKIVGQKQQHFGSLSVYQQLALLDYSDPLQGIHKIKNKLQGNKELLNKIGNDFRSFDSVRHYKNTNHDICYSTFIRRLPDGTPECHLKFHGMSSLNNLGSVVSNAINLLDPARLFKKKPDAVYEQAAAIVERHATRSKEQGMKFTLSGHSLGGGLAEHAMAMHHDLVDLAVINQPYHALGINSDALTANQAAQKKIFYPRIFEDKITPTFMWHEYPQANLIPVSCPPLPNGQKPGAADVHNRYSDYMIQNIITALS